MNNIPRQQLYQLIATYGPSLCDDPRRCEALLKDLCAPYRPEVSVLVGALKEKVAAELLASQKNMPQTVLLARLTKRIRENLALTEDAARWAVESWALALGVIQSEPKPEPPPPPPPPKSPPRRLLIGASIITIAIGTLGVYALYMPRDTDQKQIKTPNLEENYQGCVDGATAIPQCQLSLAKQLAADSKFAAAIREAVKIPSNSGVSYREAQKLISEWSSSILKTATKKYQSGNLNNAIAIAKTIPVGSSVYPKAQGTIQQWNKEWQQNQSYLQAAQKALNERKWQNAISEANKVTNHPYWKKRKESIIQKAKSQIAALKSPGVPQPPLPGKRLEIRAPRNPPPISPQPRLRPHQPQPRKRFPNQPRPRPPQPQPRPPVPHPSRTRPRFTRPSIHLSPEGLRILCKRSPLNSRCTGKHR